MPNISALCPHLTPKPSRALQAFVIGIHALALPAAWLNPLPSVVLSPWLALPAAWLHLLTWATHLALSFLVAWSLWRQLNPKADTLIVGLRLLDDGSWRLSLPDSGETDAELLGSSVSTPWFVLLHWRIEQSARRHLLICRDSLEPDEYRRLRVTLRVITSNATGAKP